MLDRDARSAPELIIELFLLDIVSFFLVRNYQITSRFLEAVPTPTKPPQLSSNCAKTKASRFEKRETFDSGKRFLESNRVDRSTRETN